MCTRPWQQIIIPEKIAKKFEYDGKRNLTSFAKIPKKIAKYYDRTIINTWLTETPCGKCDECKITKSNEWATRSWAEAKCWKNNCFITLTFDNEHLPKTKEEAKVIITNFWKRLKERKTGKEEWKNPITNEIESPIRQICCHEIGPKTGRRHFHAAVYNWKPKDLKRHEKNHRGDWLYRSKELEKVWQQGFVIIGELTYASAAYIARYVTKKMGKDSKEEFMTTSRNGGIGLQYWKKTNEKIKRNNGLLIKIKGIVMLKAIPRYFRKWWKKENETEYEIQTQKNKLKAIKTIEKQMAKTNITLEEYRKMRERQWEEKMKRLKRTNIK